MFSKISFAYLSYRPTRMSACLMLRGNSAKAATTVVMATSA